jgi:hypothetical protein
VSLLRSKGPPSCLVRIFFAVVLVTLLSLHSSPYAFPGGADENATAVAAASFSNPCEVDASYLSSSTSNLFRLLLSSTNLILPALCALPTSAAVHLVSHEVQVAGLAQASVRNPLPAEEICADATLSSLQPQTHSQAPCALQPVGASNFTVTCSHTYQEDSKLVGSGGVGTMYQGCGCSVSVSADGNTLAVRGYDDDGYQGVALLFIRHWSVWTQQGGQFVETGSVGSAYQVFSILPSADSLTLAMGGNGENSDGGATWIFRWNNTAWSQQCSKLIGKGAVGTSVYQGRAVFLSADGSTLAVDAQDRSRMQAVALRIYMRNLPLSGARKNVMLMDRMVGDIVDEQQLNLDTSTTPAAQLHLNTLAPSASDNGSEGNSCSFIRTRFQLVFLLIVAFFLAIFLGLQWLLRSCVLPSLGRYKALGQPVNTYRYRFVARRITGVGLSIMLFTAPLLVVSSPIITTLVANWCVSPTAVFTDSTSGVVYAACNGGGGVISINGTSVTTIATSSQCFHPQSVYKDTSSGLVYAACSGGRASSSHSCGQTKCTAIGCGDCLCRSVIVLCLHHCLWVTGGVRVEALSDGSGRSETIAEGVARTGEKGRQS